MSFFIGSFTKAISFLHNGFFYWSKTILIPPLKCYFNTTQYYKREGDMGILTGFMDEGIGNLVDLSNTI